jgi:protein-disulfide isomerase/uncharacterized membrane protein
MSRVNVPQVLAVALCVAGALISSKLLAKHLTGSSGSAWFEAGCTPGGEGDGAGCAAVLASPHSYWPPKRPDEPKGTPHIPLAFLGLIHFSTLGVWLVGVGRPSHARRLVHLIPLLWVSCGVLFSVRCTYIMFTRIDEWCPWCLATHVLNLLVVVGIVILWPRRAGALDSARARPPAGEARGKSISPPEGDASEIMPARPSPRCGPHPTFARVLGTLGVMLAVAYGDYGYSGLLRVKQVERTLRGYEQALVRIQRDAPRLIKNWKLAREQPITIRPDDPIRTAAQPGRTVLDVVVFSDFQCPSCSRFAPFLEKQVQPLFDQRLKVVFKHYPIDRECNPHVSATLHKHACERARIAEAARLLGGNNAFWRAHDLLFAHQRNASETGIDATEIAHELGLDTNDLLETMHSAEVTSRIDADAALARTCGVRGTPAVFVRRKRIDALAVNALAFWDALADQFWKEIGEPRPPSAELPGALTTPDILDRIDAP